MTNLITRQQELVTEILEATNHIEVLCNKTVINVPDIKMACIRIRENTLKIFELEQQFLLWAIFPGEKDER